MKMIISHKTLITVTGAVLLLTMPLTAFALLPQTVSYQGYLEDAEGAYDGTVQMVFRIYNSETAAVEERVWMETHMSVTVTNGVYSVVLGSQGSPVTLDFNEQHWLGIQVGDDSEMTPRVLLTSVPTALNADRVDGKHVSELVDTAFFNTYYDHDVNYSVDRADWANTADSADTATNAELLGLFRPEEFLRSNVFDTYTGGQLSFNPGTILRTDGDLNVFGFGLALNLGEYGDTMVTVTGDLQMKYGRDSGISVSMDSSEAKLTLGYGTPSVSGKFGEVIVNDGFGQEAIDINGGGASIDLGYGSPTAAGQGGDIYLRNSAGLITMVLNGHFGLFNLHAGTGQKSIGLDSGLASMYLGYGSVSTPGQGGDIYLYSSTGVNTISLDGKSGRILGRLMTLEESNGSNVISTTTTGVHLGDSLSPNDVDLKIWDPSISDEAFWFDSSIALLRLGSGSSTTAGDDGELFVQDAYGNVTISLDGGTGRNTMKILTVTGGSDLSEQFEINSIGENLLPQPGMVVSIDPSSPGDLIISSRKYDKRVAGIISGAGGVSTGMLMGQEGSIADGDNPVALTGRVYCMVDASYAPVEPGDMLTTSDTAGHAMKVTDYGKAHGAIIGKAMTSLDEGKGLVLVLVSLQ